MSSRSLHDLGHWDLSYNVTFSESLSKLLSNGSPPCHPFLFSSQCSRSQQSCIFLSFSLASFLHEDVMHVIRSCLACSAPLVPTTVPGIQQMLNKYTPSNGMNTISSVLFAISKPLQKSCQLFSHGAWDAWGEVVQGEEQLWLRTAGGAGAGSPHVLCHP